MKLIQIQQECSCSCGKARFSVHGTPIARFLCHCTTCQSVYKQPYADIIAIRAQAVTLPEGLNLDFRHYQPPPSVARGTCSSCNGPAVGFMSLGPLARVAFILSRNFANPAELPEPSEHVFYHRRVADIQDSIPKINGHWRSKIAAAKPLLRSIFP